MILCNGKTSQTGGYLANSMCACTKKSKCLHTHKHIVQRLEKPKWRKKLICAQSMTHFPILLGVTSVKLDATD